MKPTLTLISPTFGRTTAADLAAAVVPQLKEGDEFILVGDGPVPLAREIARLVPGVTYMETPVHTGDFGCTPWDYAIERAKGDYIMFIGDDDLPSAHAFEIVRTKLSGYVGKNDMHVFAMLHTGRVLKGTTKVCHVSNQQVVVPRHLAQQVKYAECPKKDILISDWVWLDKVANKVDDLYFHDEIICILEKQNFGGAL